MSFITETHTHTHTLGYIYTSSLQWHGRLHWRCVVARISVLFANDWDAESTFSGVYDGGRSAKHFWYILIPVNASGSKDFDSSYQTYKATFVPRSNVLFGSRRFPRLSRIRVKALSRTPWLRHRWYHRKVGVHTENSSAS